MSQHFHEALQKLVDSNLQPKDLNFLPISPIQSKATAL